MGEMTTVSGADKTRSFMMPTLLVVKGLSATAPHEVEAFG